MSKWIHGSEITSRLDVLADCLMDFVKQGLRAYTPEGMLIVLDGTPQNCIFIIGSVSSMDGKNGWFITKSENEFRLRVQNCLFEHDDIAEFLKNNYPDTWFLTWGENTIEAGKCLKDGVEAPKQEPTDVGPTVGTEDEITPRRVPILGDVLRFKAAGVNNREIAELYPEYFNYDSSRMYTKKEWDVVRDRVKKFVNGKFKGNLR